MSVGSGPWRRKPPGSGCGVNRKERKEFRDSLRRLLQWLRGGCCRLKPAFRVLPAEASVPGAAG